MVGGFSDRAGLADLLQVRILEVESDGREAWRPFFRSGRGRRMPIRPVPLHLSRATRFPFFIQSDFVFTIALL